MSQETVLFRNARIVRSDRILPKRDLFVKGGRIVSIGRLPGSLPFSPTVIDARGDLLLPGFIDLLVHGKPGEISHEQVRHGTTHFLVGVSTSSINNVVEMGKILHSSSFLGGAKPLGLRMEGPLINPKMAGAQDRRYIRKPSVRLLKRILEASTGQLKILSFAPELPGAIPLIRSVRRMGVIPALGHTDADFKAAGRAIDAGCHLATHTFNRMRPFSHRDPGTVGAVLLDDRVTAEVILDGIHVHPAAFQLLLRAKGSDRIVLVTDSVEVLRDPRARKSRGAFWLPGGTLAGSALTLDQAIRNAVRFASIGLPEAVKMAALNPARVLGLDRRKGSLEEGKDADIVVMDRNLNVKLTMVEGRIVYVRDRRIHR